MAEPLRGDLAFTWPVKMLYAVMRAIPIDEKIRMSRRQDGTIALKGSFEGVLRCIIGMAIRVGNMKADELDRPILFINSESGRRPKLFVHIPRVAEPTPPDNEAEALLAKEGETLEYILDTLEHIGDNMPRDEDAFLAPLKGGIALKGSLEAVFVNLVDNALEVARLSRRQAEEPLEWRAEFEERAMPFVVLIGPGGAGKIRPRASC